jgi:hypothetical protein
VSRRRIAGAVFSVEPIGSVAEMRDPSRAGSLFQSLRTAQRSDVDPVDVASGGLPSSRSGRRSRRLRQMPRAPVRRSAARPRAAPGSRLCLHPLHNLDSTEACVQRPLRSERPREKPSRPGGRRSIRYPSSTRSPQRRGASPRDSVRQQEDHGRVERKQRAQHLRACVDCSSARSSLREVTASRAKTLSV